MPHTPPSNATPEMLAWSRKTAGLTVDAVADAEKLPAQSITDWENAKGTPSLAVLRRLAKRYKRPVMVFYLPEPPRDFSVVKDFRLLEADVSRKFSPELLHVMRMAQERQAWASDRLADEGIAKNDLVGTLTESADIPKEAHRLRNRLGVSIADQASCESDRVAFALWRRGCEAKGIYAFQTTGIALTEMRGCALVDQYAPVVVINSQDSYTARVFTLIHEVAHILLGQSAITGAGPDVFSRAPRHKTERFCNQFAAEVLVPKRHFTSIIPPNWKDRDDQVIRRAAATYRVSGPVIGLRLVETGLASAEYLQKKWPSLQSKPKKKRDSDGGPRQYVLTLSRTGRGFTRLALSAYYAGSIHGGELSALLGMKLKHLPELESAVFPSRVQALSDVQ